MSQPNIARMLQPGGIVPIDIETTAALVAEIKSQQQARADLEAEVARLREALLNLTHTLDFEDLLHDDQRKAYELARTALKDTK